jgi:hypothetical protein
LAGLLEVHYTTTLDNADIQTLPLDNTILTRVGGQSPAPTIGNLRNRVDIVDMTAGVSALIADRLLVTTGVSFPLTQGDNRTFDWEAHLQLNYYFGGPRYRENFAPGF